MKQKAQNPPITQHMNVPSRNTRICRSASVPLAIIINEIVISTRHRLRHRWGRGAALHRHRTERAVVVRSVRVVVLLCRSCRCRGHLSPRRTGIDCRWCRGSAHGAWVEGNVFLLRVGVAWIADNGDGSVLRRKGSVEARAGDETRLCRLAVEGGSAAVLTRGFARRLFLDRVEAVGSVDAEGWSKGAVHCAACAGQGVSVGRGLKAEARV